MSSLVRPSILSAAVKVGTVLSGRWTGSAILGTSGLPPGVVGPDVASAVTEEAGVAAGAVACVVSALCAADVAVQTPATANTSGRNASAPRRLAGR